MPSDKALLRCSVCKAAFYCCREHQRADWPNHRQVCNSSTRSGQGSGDGGQPQRTPFNVVEILPNVDGRPTKSQMNNLLFPNRAEALSFMSRKGCNRIIPSAETPMVKLMGFEIDLYGKHATAADHEMNGTCINLTCKLKNGMSPYAMCSELTGVFFAVPIASCERILTCDCLWGIRQVIFEMLEDIYCHGKSPQKEQDMVKQACRSFCDQTWAPKPRNPNGVLFYGVRPEESVSGSTKSMVSSQAASARPSGSSAVPASKLGVFAQLALDYTERQHAEAGQGDSDDEAECRMERITTADFVQRHMASFPTEERTREYFQHRLPRFAASYHHRHTQRLFEAAAVWADNEKEHDRLVRLVGYELEFLGGLDAMRASYYALNHIMAAQDFWGKDACSEPDFRIISCYNKSVELLWDGVGDWAP